MRARYVVGVVVGLLGAVVEASTIDLSLSGAQSLGAPGERSMVTLRMANYGGPTEGPLRLTVVPPAFTRLEALPAGCARLHSGVVGCAVAPLDYREERSVTLTLAVDPGAPVGPLQGQATLSSTLSTDWERYQADNIALIGVTVRADGGKRRKGTVNLALCGGRAAVVGGSGVETLTVTNHGPTATRGRAVLTVLLPFFVRTDPARALPAGCEEVLPEIAPAGPEVLRCVVPRGLGVGSTASFELRLLRVTGGQVGPSDGFASVAVAPGSDDVDAEGRDDVLRWGANLLVPAIYMAPAAALSSAAPSGTTTVDAAPRTDEASAEAPPSGRDASPSSAAPECAFPARPFGAPAEAARSIRGATSEDAAASLSSAASALVIADPRLGRASAGSPRGAAGEDAKRRDASPSSAAASGSGTGTARSGGARIDLALGYDTPQVLVGAPVTVTLTIRNHGEDATGAVRLLYVVPAYVSVDETRPLPAGCSLFVESADLVSGEMVECILPPPARDATLTVALPFRTSLDAPSLAFAGQAMVVPARDSADVELSLEDNRGSPTVSFFSAPVPPADLGNRVDLYAVASLPNLRDDLPGVSELAVGNKGFNPTQGESRVLWIGPHHVRIDRERPLPEGCTLLVGTDEPEVPELVECRFPAPIAVGEEVRRTLPIRLIAGGPLGQSVGTVRVRSTPRGPDVEARPGDNGSLHGVVVSAVPPRNLALFLGGPSEDDPLSETAPRPERLPLDLQHRPAWTTAVAWTGTFEAGARFEVHLRCARAPRKKVTYQLEAVSEDGARVRPLGTVRHRLDACDAPRAVTIPVAAPVTLHRERLRLTLATASAAASVLRLGPGTSLRATRYAGSPSPASPARAATPPSPAASPPAAGR